MRYITSEREMLRVAKISSMNVDLTAIKAVAKELRTTGATDKSIAAEQGVLRIQGRGRNYLFLRSDDFKENLPLSGDSREANWTGECHSVRHDFKPEIDLCSFHTDSLTSMWRMH